MLAAQPSTPTSQCQAVLQPGLAFKLIEDDTHVHEWSALKTLYILYTATYFQQGCR